MSEAKVWDRLAKSYDRSVRLFDRSYPRVRELLHADLADREQVLEVAAGTGQFTFDLAETVGNLKATDVSPRMVQRLAGKVAERGSGNVETEVMSAYRLDVEDGSLDAIFSANALHVMQTPERALREFHRALRPSGRLVIPTFLHAANWRARLLSWLLGVVSPFVAHTKFTATSLKQMVADAGFAVREPIVLPGKFPLAYLVADRVA
ncbi:MAG: methyltransferase domain-containing protein [Myxococcales bacterium]|nr:methyltransferase domain-containing protein [Myxococcales bacterium]